MALHAGQGKHPVDWTLLRFAAECSTFFHSVFIQFGEAGCGNFDFVELKVGCGGGLELFYTIEKT